MAYSGGGAFTYIVQVNFSKIVTSKGTIRKFFNMVAVHIEGSRHPPICLIETLFSCQCPFKLIPLFGIGARKIFTVIIYDNISLVPTLSRIDSIMGSPS
jgi:hypothetical protein